MFGHVHMNMWVCKPCARTTEVKHDADLHLFFNCHVYIHAYIHIWRHCHVHMYTVKHNADLHFFFNCHVYVHVYIYTHM